MLFRFLSTTAFVFLAVTATVSRPSHAQSLSTGLKASTRTSPDAVSFARTESGLVAVEKSSSAFADFDGDGNLDLLLTGDDANGDPLAAVFLGDGAGSFTAAEAGIIGVAGGSASVGNVDDDGNLDLVVTGREFFFDSPSAKLRLGDGQGGFVSANSGLTGVSGGSSSFGDVNGDGALDLVLTGNTRNSIPANTTATLYLGDGQGSFAATDAGLIGVGAGSSSFGDINNDGHLDLVLTGFSMPNIDEEGAPTATLYLGNGQGDFTAADAGLTGAEHSSSSFGDVDNDGNLDLVITGRDTSGTPTTTLYRGDGQGGFTAVGTGLVGVEKGSSSFGDIDSDGILDLVVTGEDSSGTPTATLYLGDGNGGFTPSSTGLRGVRNGSSSFGDVNNDGRLDLAITGEDSSGTPTAMLYKNVVAGNLQVAVDSSTVETAGTVDFGATGVDVRFIEVSGSGAVRVRKFDNRPSRTQGIDEANVSDYRFVISADGDLTLEDEAEVFFDLGTLDGIGAPTNVAVYRRPVAGNGRFATLPTVLDADGNLVATTGAFSEFVLASDTEPLPVELTSFDATRDGDGAIRLVWTTASETNNAGFEVRRMGERENGGTGTWKRVGFVDGAGTTSDLQTYRFTDADAPFAAERVRYRLRQIDTDGSAHLSETVTVALGTPERLRLHAPFPNPARSRATLRYELPRATGVQIAVYDVIGRRVATLLEGRKDAGRHQIQLSAQQLPSGTYFLRLAAGERTTVRQWAVVR